MSPWRSSSVLINSSNVISPSTKCCSPAVVGASVFSDHSLSLLSGSFLVVLFLISSKILLICSLVFNGLPSFFVLLVQSFERSQQKIPGSVSVQFYINMYYACYYYGLFFLKIQRMWYIATNRWNRNFQGRPTDRNRFSVPLFGTLHVRYLRLCKLHYKRVLPVFSVPLLHRVFIA